MYEKNLNSAMPDTQKKLKFTSLKVRLTTKMSKTNDNILDRFWKMFTAKVIEFFFSDIITEQLNNANVKYWFIMRRLFRYLCHRKAFKMVHSEQQ